MEPEYICRITCETTLTNLFRHEAIYDVMEIDGEYFVFNDRYEHSEVFKSDYNENVWLTADGKTARFLECNAR
ncbi:hypothetical protein AB9E46_18255 [Escherichia coli]|jgi:hypothetical protein|uniref:hypothetical protein n=1 Tax=Escherichia coli TaxID=562 RepID=UPI000B7D7D6C|nr:hypothetical protein [Escherichia coli]HBK2949276.1 hypothetical protein [Escherichia coli]HCN5972327.1 hypothetical protein [Escherichia coli]HCP1225685.1 hypothetical protein [Escherichia coli]